MSLDLEQPAPELDSSAVSTESADPNPNEIDSDGLLETQQQPEDEIEEEFEGLKVRGKKDLLEEFKKGRMLHADYTRKTQEVAELRRSYETERESFQKTQQLHQQVEQDKFKFWSAQERLQQLQQVNLSALRQTNPELAESLRDELVQLSTAVPGMGQALNAKLEQLEQSKQHDDAKLDRQLAEFVAREFKGGWNQEKDVQMMAFVQRHGLNPEATRAIIRQNPVALRILDKAAKYDQLLAQRFQKKPAEQQKPVTRIGGTSAANTKPLSEITDPNEWRSARNRRLGRTT